MNAAARAELETIRLSNGGFLRPVDVIKYAKNKKTALHNFFTWDDGRAAELYRLEEARRIIRVIVQVSEHSSENVRAFVSIQSDRHAAGGYRAFADVVDEPELMVRLIEQAKQELAAFQRKYDHLREIAELTGVFAAIDSVVTTKTKDKSRGLAISA